jgi:drug/metabolite transporter (DMT)-like permease
MPSYVIFALLAYLLLAVHGVVDKFLLSGPIRRPIAYTFFSGSTTIFVLFLAPFGLEMLKFWDMVAAFVVGGAFLFATYYLYSAIQQSSVSRILPIQGGLVPIFTYVLAHFILGEVLTEQQTWAFLLLTLGSVLLSLKHEQGRWHAPAFITATAAAVLFAVSLVLSKYVFEQSNLITGLVWSRIGSFLLAMSFLLFKEGRKAVFSTPREAGVKNGVIFYAIRFLGALAGFFQNYAIYLGSVVIVNALQGFQFAFLLVLTSALSVYNPKILNEKISGPILALKIFAIFLISTGIILIAT